MTDVKQAPSRNVMRRRAQKRNKYVIPRNPLLNETLITVGWTNSAVTSGTAGTIAVTSGFSIQETTEYSAIANLFGEVRLVAAQVIFISGRATDTTTVNAQMYMGYDIRYNSVTASNPTSRALQMALPKFTLWNAQGAVKALRVNVPIPKNLEFTRVDSDTPSAPVPYAGSPGVWSIWADGAAASTGYASWDTRATYHLRYRI